VGQHQPWEWTESLHSLWVFTANTRVTDIFNSNPNWNFATLAIEGSVINDVLSTTLQNGVYLFPISNMLHNPRNGSLVVAAIN